MFAAGRIDDGKGARGGQSPIELGRKNELLVRAQQCRWRDGNGMGRTTPSPNDELRDRERHRARVHDLPDEVRARPVVIEAHRRAQPAARLDRLPASRQEAPNGSADRTSRLGVRHRLTLFCESASAGCRITRDFAQRKLRRAGFVPRYAPIR
jgi:hypothetical protein